MRGKDPAEHLQFSPKIERTMWKLRKEKLEDRFLDLEEFSSLKHEKMVDANNNNFNNNKNTRNNIGGMPCENSLRCFCTHCPTAKECLSIWDENGIVTNYLC